MDGKYIIVSARGANAGYINAFTGRYWAGNSCYSVLLDEKLCRHRYAYYFLKTQQEKLVSKQQKAGIPAVSKEQLGKVKVIIPSIEKQEEIVSILDKFDQLANDIS